ncbi:MAG: amidohydrolase family protein [bacterium]|nr:amidohydrolase family protein [bacterium]
MVKSIILFICVILLMGTSVYARETKEGNKEGNKHNLLVLTNVVMIDGIGNKPVPGCTIVINKDTITEIYRPGKTGKKKEKKKRSFPDDAFVMDLEGLYVIPGLIDAHVHISQYTRQEAEKVLARTLLGGVTTLRDMGGDARRLAGIKRDALLNEMDAPNIYYSAIFAGPTFFTDPRVIAGSAGLTAGKVPWGREITASTDIRLAVAEAKGCGATGIKIYADLPVEEVRRVTEEGHRQGMKVWSHATVHPTGPLDAVLAGVDVISHSPLLAWESQGKIPPSYAKRYEVSFDLEPLKSTPLKRLFREMKERGTILDATVYVFNYGVIKGKDTIAKEHARAAYALEAVKMAHRKGVKISVGTDFLYDKDKPLPNLHEELELLVTKCGLTPMEALQAATRINAEVIGIENHTGTISKGKQADLVVLTANPLKSISNTRKIRYVLKAGKLFSRE